MVAAVYFVLFAAAVLAAERWLASSWPELPPRTRRLLTLFFILTAVATTWLIHQRLFRA